MCVFLSVGHGKIRLPLDRFSWNLVFEYFFLKSFEKTEISLKSARNNGYFTWSPIYIFITSLSFLLRMKNASDKIYGENQSTNIFFSDLFFNRAVCEIMWKNIVERGRAQMAVWRMRIVCWITRATNTHSEYFNTWFKTFAVFWMLYTFFWIIPLRLNFICRRFGTHCYIFIGGSAYENGTEFRNVGI
jgi:hypothetical protein